MNSVLIYTKDNCPYCDQAKALFRAKDQRFNESKIGIDISREDFMETFPDVKSVPLIIINGDKVGGYDKLTEWYRNNGQQLLSE